VSGLSIPSWQQAELAQLSGEGLLSGVSPLYLAVIDQAESSGQGGGLNPQGYGGYFGLGAGSTYPAGTPSSALLSNPSQQSFDAQAEIAASTFAQDLSSAGGSPIGAEGIYQTGSASPAGGPSEGQLLMQELLGGTATSTPSTPSATDTLSISGLAAGTSPLNLPGAGSAVSAVTSTAISAGLQAVLPAFGRLLLYVAFVVGGIVLVVLGLQRLTGAKVPLPVPVPV